VYLSEYLTAPFYLPVILKRLVLLEEYLSDLEESKKRITFTIA
jgi:hypothetical protein